MPICPNCKYEFKSHKDHATLSEIKEFEDDLRRMKRNIKIWRYSPLLFVLFIVGAILIEYLLAQRWIIPIDLHVELVVVGAALMASEQIAESFFRINKEVKRLEIRLRESGALSESESLLDLIKKLK